MIKKIKWLFFTKKTLILQLKIENVYDKETSNIEYINSDISDKELTIFLLIIFCRMQQQIYITNKYMNNFNVNMYLDFILSLESETFSSKPNYFVENIQKAFLNSKFVLEIHRLKDYKRTRIKYFSKNGYYLTHIDQVTVSGTEINPLMLHFFHCVVQLWGRITDKNIFIQCIYEIALVIKQEGINYSSCTTLPNKIGNMFYNN